MSAGRDVLAQLRLEDDRPWTEAAYDWQLEDALAVLEGAEPYNFITRPRAGSKTSDLAGIGIAWLLAGVQHGRYFAGAADADQARLLLDSIEGFARRTPSIGQRLRIESRKVAADTGATLEVVPADAASSWGIRPNGVIIDELARWADVPSSHQLLDSLLTSASKVAGCRVAVITAPSSPSHFSYKLKEHAEADELWRLSEKVGIVEWLDPARVEEQRRRLPEFEFERLYEGRWAEGDENLTTVEDVRGCVTHEGILPPESGKHYIGGLDIGITNDRTAFAIGHREGERIVIDLLAVWRGTKRKPVRVADVEAYIEQAAKDFRCEVIADYTQVAHLTQRLQERGVRIRWEHFSAPGNAKRAVVMVNLLRDRRLGLPDDEALLDELSALKLVEKSPGNYKVDHRSGKHDDQAQAIALVASELSHEVRPGKPKTISKWLDGGIRRHQAKLRAEQAKANPKLHKPPPPPPQPRELGDSGLVHKPRTRR